MTRSATEILGAAITSGFGEGILQGMLFNELGHFLQKETNNRIILITVYWINTVALAQTCVAAYNYWNMLVTNFANVSILTGFGWPVQIQPILTSFMSGPVHGYFIYRCWISTHQNWPLTICLSLGAALSILAAWLNAVSTFAYTMNNFTSNELSRLLTPAFNIWLISSSVLDVCITAILLNYLIRSRTRTYSRYLTLLIDRLIAMAWQSACPPCICAIVTCAISASATLQGTHTYWWFVPGAFLGKLYCMCLMFTLNNRELITQQFEVTDPHAPTTLPGVAFDLRTDFDQPDASTWSTMHSMGDAGTSSCAPSNSKTVVIEPESSHVTNR